MTDLSDHIPSLERMVAPPGQFSTLFPEATDADLVGYLTDGLAEAQMDGFLVTPDLFAYDEDGIVTPDLSQSQLALVVLYAGTRLLQTQLRNTQSLFRAKAGPVEFETQNAASVLTEALKELTQRKKDLINNARKYNGGSFFAMADMYIPKSLDCWAGYPGSAFEAL